MSTGATGPTLSRIGQIGQQVTGWPAASAGSRPCWTPRPESRSAIWHPQAVVVQTRRLDARGWYHLAAGLRTGDPDHELLAADSSNRSPVTSTSPTTNRRPRSFGMLLCLGRHDRHPKCRRFVAPYTAGRNRPGLTPAARATTPDTNHQLVNKIKQVERGSHNFDNYRLRLLLHYGVTWQDQPPTHRKTPGPHSTTDAYSVRARSNNSDLPPR
jgi:hypothetical protein